MARSEPMADASLPDMRARSSPGTAIAAMMPMIATTISSSIKVKPLELRMLIAVSSRCEVRNDGHGATGMPGLVRAKTSRNSQGLRDFWYRRTRPYSACRQERLPQVVFFHVVAEGTEAHTKKFSRLHFHVTRSPQGFRDVSAL